MTTSLTEGYRITQYLVSGGGKNTDVQSNWMPVRLEASPKIVHDFVGAKFCSRQTWQIMTNMVNDKKLLLLPKESSNFTYSVHIN